MNSHRIVGLVWFGGCLRDGLATGRPIHATNHTHTRESAVIFYIDHISIATGRPNEQKKTGKSKQGEKNQTSVIAF